MTTDLAQRRRQKFFQLSSQIAQIDTAQLCSLLDVREARTSWGGNQTLEFAGSPVFVKRIPLTDREQANLFSTRNLHELPTYYNYGVGSAGFGVFRELVTHIKTTNWVLSGEIETFPLLYHYRVIPFTGTRAEVDMERHRGYIEYWGGSENIGNYMLDRANANYELVLFLEYFPFVLQPWLQENPAQVGKVLDSLRETLDFLRKNGIIHFDAHFHNILTDGAQVYLTDFGLALDLSFALTEAETAFFETHTLYDYGVVLWCLVFLLNRTFEALPESEQRHLREKYRGEEGREDYFLLDNLEAIHAGGVMKIGENCRACLLKYRDIIVLMHDFYSALRHDNTKATPFPDANLKRLLEASGFVSDSTAMRAY